MGKGKRKGKKGGWMKGSGNREVRKLQTETK